MLKFLCAAAIGVALALPAAPAAAQQQPKTKAKAGKCIPPRDICFQKCLEQGGRQCTQVCNTRPNTC